MTMLDHTAHPLVAKALDLARTWYTPELLRHAQHAAITLNVHVPDAAPELLAAALLAHSPKAAPNNVNTNALLTKQLSPRVARLVRTIGNEYQALRVFDDFKVAALYVSLLIRSDPEAACISAADKIEALTKLDPYNCDPEKLGLTNETLTALKIYIAFFCTHAATHIPISLTTELTQAINKLPA